MSTHILMEGYYGKSNFGDDVLMCVTYHLLRSAIANTRISIVIGDTQHDYPGTMLEGIEIERPNRHAHYDLIVHGGGGVFFDFNYYGRVRRSIETLARIIGFNNVVRLERILRTLSGLHRVTSTRRIGLGIGVGTFTHGSPRMLRSLPILAEYNALWLRDDESTTNLKRFAGLLRAELLQGSDLAFFNEVWTPPPTEKTPRNKPKLGIALRDWVDMDYTHISNQLTELAQHYALTGFIFDAQHDMVMRQILAPYPTNIWQPETMSIHEFAAKIATQDGLITSRAHGAICSACLGVPSTIINIEPKMQQVHSMLPNSTQLIDMRQPWVQATTNMLATPQAHIAEDVARNRAFSQEAWSQIKRWLT